MYIHLKYTDNSTIYSIDGEQIEFVGGRRSGDVVVNGDHVYRYQLRGEYVQIIDEYDDLVEEFEDSDDYWERYAMELAGVA